MGCARLLRELILMAIIDLIGIVATAWTPIQTTIIIGPVIGQGGMASCHQPIVLTGVTASVTGPLYQWCHANLDTAFRFFRPNSS
jgi:hypothetical protein